MKEYELTFKGYWVEPNISAIPKTSGVYLVYRCIHEYDAVVLKDLIYIGQTYNLYDRIKSHEKKILFNKECQAGETLCYSIAEVLQNDLDVVENSLIFAQKPKLNDQNKDSFNHQTPVNFLIEGKCGLLKYRKFTIK